MTLSGFGSLALAACLLAPLVGSTPIRLTAVFDRSIPFADNIELAAGGGITAIIQPGGSVRDAEVVEAANRHGIAMVMTGRRQFRH